jgi:Na+/H+ antiporter NhaC
MTSFVLLEALMSKDSEAIRQARVRQLLAQMKIKLGNIAMVLFLVAMLVLVLWFMAGQVADPPEQTP